MPKALKGTNKPFANTFSWSINLSSLPIRVWSWRFPMVFLINHDGRLTGVLKQPGYLCLRDFLLYRSARKPQLVYDKWRQSCYLKSSGWSHQHGRTTNQANVIHQHAIRFISNQMGEWYKKLQLISKPECCRVNSV